MTTKTLAVILFTRAEAEWLAPAACELARGLDAHLIGVVPVLPFFVHDAAGFDPVVIPTIAKWQTEETDAIRALFDEAVRRADVRGEFRAQERVAAPTEEFALAATRAADVIVMAPKGDGGSSEPTDRLRAPIIRLSGRPVLIMPRDAALTAAPSRLLIGWSDTREATRAAHDALTLAAPGARIDLLAVRSGRAEVHAMDARQDFAAALDRLGYSAELIDRDGPAGEISRTLMEVATERDAELVVTGAFGHSAVYDFVIGAVTSDLLDAPKRPVLLSK